MDTKQIQTNIFTGGLNTDLHPLTTPNNILTDCINGTIITYNGNEFILQNDMGNYKLNLSSLKNNYIPIGIKEYNGIIYVVSYNPVDKLTEIGSFPFPKRTYNSDNTGTKEYTDLEIEEYSRYTELVKKEVVVLYSSSKDFILNPGDSYYVQFPEQEQEYGYITLDFYVLSLEKKLYKLDKYVENIDRNYSNGYVKTHQEEYSNSYPMDKVNWDTPGLLAFKFRVAYIDSFNLYLTKFKYPRLDTENLSPEYTVLANIVTSDTLFYDPNLKNNLKVRLYHGFFYDKKKCYLDKQSEEYIEYNDFKDFKDFDTYRFNTNNGESENVKEKIYSPINIVYHTDDIDNPFPINFKKEFKDFGKEAPSDYFIEAVPYLEIGSENEPRRIIYDQYTSTILLKRQEWDSINIFEEYSYYISKQENEKVNILVNFSLFASNTSNLTTQYNILKFNFEKSEESGKYKIVELDSIIGSPKTEELNFSGQNILDISIGNFEEDIYLFKVSITDNINNSSETKSEESDNTKSNNTKNYYRFLILNTGLNQFYGNKKYPDFGKIPFNEWINSALDSFEINKIEVEESSSSSSMLTNTNDNYKDFEYKYNNDDWKRDFPVKVSSDLSGETGINPKIGIRITKELTFSPDNNKFGINIPSEDLLWKNKSETFDITINYENKKPKQVLIKDDEPLTDSLEFNNYYENKLIFEKKDIHEYERWYFYDFGFSKTLGERNRKGYQSTTPDIKHLKWEVDNTNKHPKLEDIWPEEYTGDKERTVNYGFPNWPHYIHFEGNWGRTFRYFSYWWNLKTDHKWMVPANADEEKMIDTSLSRPDASLLETNNADVINGKYYNNANEGYPYLCIPTGGAWGNYYKNTNPIFYLFTTTSPNAVGYNIHLPEADGGKVLQSPVMIGKYTDDSGKTKYKMVFLPWTEEGKIYIGDALNENTRNNIAAIIEVLYRHLYVYKDLGPSTVYIVRLTNNVTNNKNNIETINSIQVTETFSVIKKDDVDFLNGKNKFDLSGYENLETYNIKSDGNSIKKINTIQISKSFEVADSEWVLDGGTSISEMQKDNEEFRNIVKDNLIEYEQETQENISLSSVYHDLSDSGMTGINSNTIRKFDLFVQNLEVSWVDVQLGYFFIRDTPPEVDYSYRAKHPSVVLNLNNLDKYDISFDDGDGHHSYFAYTVSSESPAAIPCNDPNENMELMSNYSSKFIDKKQNENNSNN